MLNIDQHEPPGAMAAMASAVPCQVAVLNERGWADYMWKRADGGYTQVERKTWGELLGSIDKIEDQLRRHKANQPDARLIFVLEGLAVPNFSGTTLLRSTNKDRVFTAGYTTTQRMSQVYAWLYQVSTFVEVFQTPTTDATYSALTAFYKGDQKDEHRTFQRPFKEITYHPNPQVVQLMGLLPGIGEKRATALIKKFSTVWNVVSASPKELQKVEGIGPTLSTTMLRKIGRWDID